MSQENNFWYSNFSNFCQNVKP